MNQNSETDQTALVDRFPAEFGKDTNTEGVIRSVAAAECVLVALKLGIRANSLVFDENRPDAAEIFLRANPQFLGRILGAEHGITGHAFLIRDLIQGGVEIMDPAEHDYTPLTWPELHQKRASLLVLGN